MRFDTRTDITKKVAGKIVETAAEDTKKVAKYLDEATKAQLPEDKE